jgi:hypothetical protein
VCHKGALEQNVPDPSPIASSISKRVRDGKSERIVSAEELSLAMLVCLKIAGDCSFMQSYLTPSAHRNHANAK